jgi:hypothetical protein
MKARIVNDLTGELGALRQVIQLWPASANDLSTQCAAA